MKIHSARYATVTSACVFAVCALVIAAESTEAKWMLMSLGAMLSGILTYSIIPFNERGD